MPVDLTRYVRCRDLDGELWTIPKGTRLHLQLLGDLTLGNPEPFLPVEVIRRPDQGLKPIDLPATLNSSEIPSTALWRIGQYLRLKERIERRVTSTPKA